MSYKCSSSHGKYVWRGRAAKLKLGLEGACYLVLVIKKKQSIIALENGLKNVFFCNLSIPSERAHFGLPNATFLIEIGYSFLKLQLVE